jgi:hypothetical protein
MSERDPNQAPDEDAEHFDLDGPAQPSARPVSGTYHAPHEADPDWQGTTGATDFLGLDGDLRLDPHATATPMEGYPGLSSSGEAPALDSWLMEIEGGVDAPPGSEQLDEAGLEDAVSAESTSDEELEEAAAPRPRAGVVAQLAMVVFVVALAGGGAWYWQHHNHEAAPVEVATRPTPKSTPKPKLPAPAHGTNPDAPAGPSTAVTPGTDANPSAGPTTGTNADPESAVLPTITIPDPDSVVPPTAGPDGTAVATDTHGTREPATTDTTIDTAPPPLTITFPPAPTPKPTAPTTPVATTPRPLSKGATMPGTVRRATEADYADLWRETRIPTELFQGDRKMRTLNVGRVRALVIGGEYFEGTLYAVGQNRIWMDLDLGRISFEATTVRELAQLPPLPADKNAKTKKADDLAGLPHVEVRLLGGSVTGRLVGQDGRRVTLITDDGLRTVVESDDVRPVTARNTRVLGTVKELDSKPH